MATYRHTEGMVEISGFGGSYEAGCQDMLEAGVNWLEANKETIQKGSIKISGLKGVIGYVHPESDLAEEMSKTIIEACPDCTGAMHHAVMVRLLDIAKIGWDAYCEKYSKKNAEKHMG